MKEQIAIDAALWREFAAAAQQQRRNPLTLLAAYMRESLEIWEHQKVDREIQQAAHQSGYTEDDAVELVRQYRRESAALKPAANSFRQGWHEAQQGETAPLATLWEGAGC